MRLSTWRCGRCRRLNHYVTACECGQSFDDNPAIVQGAGTGFAEFSSPPKTFAYALLGVALALAIVGFGLQPTLDSDYGELLSSNTTTLLLSPIGALIPSIFTLGAARYVTGFPVSYWTAYKATFVAHLLIGMVSMLVFTTAASAMLHADFAVFATIPSVFGVMTWVFASLLTDNAGRPIGLGLGLRIVGLLFLAAVAIILALIAVAWLAIGPPSA